MRKYVILAFSFALSACTPGWDMHGNDPKEYYAEHPIENKIEARQVAHVVHFAPVATKLTVDESARLRSALHPVSPLALDGITIQLAQEDMKNAARKSALTRTLRSMGYSVKPQFESSAALAKGDAEIDVTYSAVVAPDCPDWRTSPVTSYSNTWQGNFKCAGGESWADGRQSA